MGKRCHSGTYPSRHYILRAILLDLSVSIVPANNWSCRGDTLFRGGIGRTDLWGGDAHAIQSSIRERLFSLDPDTRVIPGHGPATQIGLEQES